MAEKNTSVIAGFGGAAVVAALMSIGGASSPPDAGSTSGSAAVTETAPAQIEMTSNQEGPWYALCQEYATNEFDQGKDPSRQRGITGHRVPEEADEGTVEVTHTIKNGDQEKFNVRKHMVGDFRSCVPENARLRVLVATVPDPNATQMPLEFDRDIEAIQAAAAAEHYNYTRFWYPWRSRDWTADKSADPEDEVRRRQEPGILCFRKNDHKENSQERLFVLLVGETPTSGVNRIQLAHALYYRQQFKGGKDDQGKILPDELIDGDQNFVSIAGPHFSASFKAIQDVLAASIYQSSSPTPVVNLVSPDSSGWEYLQEFRKFCQDQRRPCTLRTLSLSSVDVTTTAVRFLRSLGYKPPHIAQWNEDESAFGVRQFNNAENLYGLTLQFPRDLSSARSRSDRQSSRIAESGSKYFVLPTARPATHLTSREPIDRDSPAPFGSEQETSEVARSLADSVREMRAYRIDAVVINATNPLDTIYLLEYLHNELPDIRVVTTHADELELDRPHFVDLTGTIAITDLPPLTGLMESSPLADGQATAAKRRVTFKSSRQEGEFLAVRTLLESNQVQKESPHPPPCYVMSVVTETGFRLLPYWQGGEKDDQPTFPCTVDPGRPHATPVLLTAVGNPNPFRSFLSFLVFVIFLNILHLRCIVTSRRCIDRSLSYPRPLLATCEPTRLYLIFVANNQVFLLNTLGTAVSFAAWNAIGRNESHDPWLMFLLPCVGLLTVVTVILSAYFFRLFSLSMRNPAVENKSARWSQMAIATLYLCTSAWMLLSLPALWQRGSLFLARITSLFDGLSPVLPISAIILGYFLWAFLHLKRLAWAASRKADLGASPHIEEYFESRIRSLGANLETLEPQKKSARLILFPLGIFIAFLLWKSLSGFDGRGFHLWIVAWGVVMLLLTVILTCLHAWAIWAPLQKLLEWLETTPMRETFQQIGDDGLLQIKVWDLAKPQRSFTVLSRTVDVIEQLDGPDSENAKNANHQLQYLLRADVTHRQLPPNRIELMSQALNIHMEEAIRAIYADERVHRAEKLRRYLALRLIALIRYSMLHIGIMICFVAYGYVLAVISVMFYAFEGRRSLNVLVVTTFVALLIWIGMMMTQFQRNNMLSRLEGSTPGKVSYGQLAFHLLGVGGLPLLAIVTSQFPGIAGFAFSFFRPVLGALR
jgi:hypothetical protein